MDVEGGWEAQISDELIWNRRGISKLPVSLRSPYSNKSFETDSCRSYAQPHLRLVNLRAEELNLNGRKKV